MECERNMRAAQCKYHKGPLSAASSIAISLEKIFMFWLFHVAFRGQIGFAIRLPPRASLMHADGCVFLTVFVTFNLCEIHMPSGVYSPFYLFHSQSIELITDGSSCIYLSIQFIKCKLCDIHLPRRDFKPRLFQFSNERLHHNFN